MGAVRLRRAGAADDETLAAIGRETFAEAFGHNYPPADLADFLAEAHAPEQYRAWALDPAFALWIAEADGDPVGYALAGPCALPHPEVTAQCGELWRLYVRGVAQGLGVGERLLTTALRWLAAPGRRLWIGVWSENHAAQRLYARKGFTRVGEYLFRVGQTRDHEFIFRRDEPAARA